MSQLPAHSFGSSAFLPCPTRPSPAAPSATAQAHHLPRLPLTELLHPRGWEQYLWLLVYLEQVEVRVYTLPPREGVDHPSRAAQQALPQPAFFVLQVGVFPVQ